VNGILDAGVFSFCFSYSVVFYTIGYYGGRIYQVSDAENEYPPKSYIRLKFVTSAVMFLVAIAFVLANSYSIEKASLLIALVAFKICEAICDAIYGVIQKCGRLYIAGYSMTLKGAIGFALFLAIDVATKNILFASIGLVAVNLIIILIYDVRKMRGLGPKDTSHTDIRGLLMLMKSMFSVFLLAFLSNLIINVPRYFIDVFHEDAQGYFGIVVMPATAVALFGMFILQPRVVTLSEMLAKGDYTTFNRVIFRLISVALAVGVFGTVAAYFLGAPILTLIYGVDLYPYKWDIALIVLGGVANVIIMIFSSALVIMRKFPVQVVLYVTTVIIITILSVMFVNSLVVMGGVISYLIANTLQCISYAVAYRLILRKNKAGSVERKD
jgi:O-antigen/teichoic acid export membrane protein